MLSICELENAFAQSISNILNDPLLYFSESDIHSIIYSDLIKKLPNLNKLIETKLTIGLNRKKDDSKKKYKTICLHREYGINGIDYARSDIVIFDEKDISDIIDPINLKTGKTKNDYLQPQFILEFGTEKSAGSASLFESHLTGDIEKASYSKKFGYIVHLQRVYNRDNDISKYAEYENIINSIMDKLHNVKVLFFLISIGSDTVSIFREGKVKLYSSKNKKVKGIPKTKYVKLIMDELNYQEKIF